MASLASVSKVACDTSDRGDTSLLTGTFFLVFDLRGALDNCGLGNSRTGGDLWRL